MKIRTALITSLLIVGSLLLFAFYRDHQLQTNFVAIKPLSTEAQVIEALGPASEVQRPCQAYDTQLTANCDHVLVYKSRLSPFRRQYWLIFFDSNSQATATSSQLAP